MKRYLFLLTGVAIILMVVTGCAEAPRDEEEKEKEKIEKKEEAKEEVEIIEEYSEDAFVEIWAQMQYLTEKHLSEDFSGDMNAYTAAIEQYDSELQKVFDEYNANHDVFNDWLEYLGEHPEKNHEVFQLANKRLEELRDDE